MGWDGREKEGMRWDVGGKDCGRKECLCICVSMSMCVGGCWWDIFLSHGVRAWRAGEGREREREEREREREREELWTMLTCTSLLTPVAPKGPS